MEELNLNKKVYAKNQYKNPGWWVSLILFVLMCWGGYKLVIHFMK